VKNIAVCEETCGQSLSPSRTPRTPLYPATENPKNKEQGVKSPSELLGVTRFSPPGWAAAGTGSGPPAPPAPGGPGRAGRGPSRAAALRKPPSDPFLRFTTPPVPHLLPAEGVVSGPVPASSPRTGTGPPAEADAAAPGRWARRHGDGRGYGGAQGTNNPGREGGRGRGEGERPRSSWTWVWGPRWARRPQARSLRTQRGPHTRGGSSGPARASFPKAHPLQAPACLSLHHPKPSRCW